ncbi:hypothetical protein PUNSTDRAFT_61047 [Punctularia strigosozonata HHB-11173 SS5]|uniref:uncharacterized protein n=1 Tax=Punctularia strigosozonata (strain HHB-11173) TaxID=741275 RepID=UPI000441789F|nr:uncharacterized protein PUNSTDRAFT_61047 [Punctularia strigosozonata HHB-11173 SS5]EIN12509.1 hypothetical protein PUNSTDRAFT_61047 [Punctularia strigosozonata HHB-11173 SS5]
MEELSIYAHSLSTHTLTFPDPDLLHELTNLYFAHSNVYTPILHRPMFEKALADGLHLRDTGFGGVVLLVCAIASRYTHDPRVFLRGAPTQSAGWKWYSQVEMVRKSPLAPPRLYDVQQYALASVFLVGCSAPHVTWNMIGLGVRMCLDVSAHRKKVYKATGPDQIIEEQWKRAFWGLVNMDRIASNEMGRVVAVLDEDIDAPLPCECDDEYFVSPDRTRYFVQPPEKPSLVAYVNIMISLRSIQLKAQRSLVGAFYNMLSMVSHKLIMGNVVTIQFSTLREKSYDYEVKVVAELNADLDRWRDAVPSHLRWETALAAADDHPIFFRQCTASWTVYHYARIIIHRPFAVGLRRNTPLGMASVEVCYNSAREIARMFRDLLKRDSGPFGLHMFSAFTAASVLLLMKWTQDREGDGTLESPSEQDLKHVYTCMNVIKTSEPRLVLSSFICRPRLRILTCVMANTDGTSPADYGMYSH